MACLDDKLLAELDLAEVDAGTRAHIEQCPRCRKLARAAEPARVIAAVESVVAKGRGAWPDLDVDADAFAMFVFEGLSEEAELLSSLAAIHAADICLASACRRGDEAALAAFRGRYGPALRHAVRRNAADEQVDDLVQQVWAKLFVGEAPAIGKYAGRGKLSTWVQSVATRHVLSSRRGQRPAEADDEALEFVVGEDDPEANALKQRYRLEFKKAFHSALGQLTSRQRNLLRHEYLDGLNIDGIGAIYGVHRATVARWRAQCRGELKQKTVQILRADHGLALSEVDSMLRLIESQMNLSLTRALQDEQEA